MTNDGPLPPELRAVLNHGGYSRAKAALDFVLGAVLLVLSSPLVLAAAALVRLTSAGPAFYSQERVGRNGRSFRVYKLRSMYHDCERLSGPRWSTAGDPRVTPLGRVLRRTHVDELPQLWNVLRGEMSLVGPRPERPYFVGQLEAAIPGYSDRLLVRPGITGLAQVLLPPDEDFDGVCLKVAHDRTYLAEMSLLFDARILLATVFKVVGVPFDVTREVLNFPSATGADATTSAKPAHAFEVASA